MCGSRKFSQSGSNFEKVFLLYLVDEGREGPNTIPL